MDCLKILKLPIFLGLRRKKNSIYQYYRKGVELWILDLETRTAKKISNDNLNANLGFSVCLAEKNSQELIMKTSANRPALLNEKKNLPTGWLFLMQTEKFHKTEHIKIY